jgi:ribulose-phosphate 3-epimerase
MASVIPAILAHDEQEFRKRFGAIAPVAPMIHIDVLDGSLFPERSFANAERIAALHLPIPFGVHLMVNEPQDAVKKWIQAGATRLIVHVEAQGNLGAAFETIRHYSHEAGLALNPETELTVLDEWAPFIQYVLVMGVHPGAMGRPFDPKTITRVRAIHKKFPTLTIGVDGGVKAKGHRAHELAVAGAAEIVVGSGIWNAEDPLAAYNELVADAKL